MLKPNAYNILGEKMCITSGTKTHNKNVIMATYMNNNCFFKPDSFTLGNIIPRK